MNKGSYSVYSYSLPFLTDSVSYSSKNFEENIPECEEYVTFDEHLFGRRLLVFLIDKKTTNPYRLAEKKGVRDPDEEQKKILREEGRLKAIIDEKYDGKLIKIKLTHGLIAGTIAALMIISGNIVFAG